MHKNHIQPKLYLFNPTNEMAIANGQVSYMPPRHLQRFENDMATFPWIFGNKEDYILVSKKDGNSLAHLHDLGWEVPTPITSPDEISFKNEDGLFLAPWGWSPSVYRTFKPFSELLHPAWHNHPFSRWDETLAHLLSRETGYKLLETISRLKSESPANYSDIYLPEYPTIVKKQQELSKIFETCPPPSVIKTPWSASGRGLFRIRNQGDDPARSPWVKGMLRKQGKLYIESLLNKIQDVSFQFMIKENNVEYIGHNFFYTDPSGQFAGCDIGGPVNHSRLFNDWKKINTAIFQATNLIKQGIELLKLDKQYEGPAGVDGIFFKDDEGLLKLQPCLEINLRYNMGAANIFLKKRIHPEAKGTWKTGVFKNNEWMNFCLERTRKNPPRFTNGKLHHGFLPFTDPNGNKLFGAWLDLWDCNSISPHY